MADHYLTRAFEFTEAGNANLLPPAPSVGVIPIFFMQTIRDEFASEKHGTPRFMEQEWVRILIPGDKLAAVVRRVKEDDKTNFAKYYDAFAKAQDVAIDGTPLENWNWLTRSQVEMFKALGLFTVEQLANVSDGNLQQLGMGARQMRTMALNHLETLKAGSVPIRLQLERDKAVERAEAAERTINSLAARLAELERKAGTDITALNDPQMSRVTANEVSVTGVPIPDNYEDLPLAELRALATKLTVAPIRNKAEAVQAIAEYKAEQATRKH